MVSNPSGTLAESKAQAQALEPIGTPGESSYADDEIDFIGLVLALWAGKWLILSITLASTVITLAYLQIFPHYTVSLKVQPNPVAEDYVYKQINATGWLVVNRDSLWKLWLEDVKSYKTLEKALIDHNYLPKNASETEQEFKRRLREIASQYKLSLDVKNKNKDKHWSMQFTSSMPETDRLVLQQAFTESNNNVRTVLEATFQNSVKLHEQNNDFAYTDLEIQKHNVLLTEGETNKKQLERLKEQNQIAHALNIADPYMAQSPDDTATSIPVLYDARSFMRGFKAIEVEISLRQKRDIEAHSQSIIDIKNKQRSIQQDQKTTQNQLVFDATPIQSDDFRAASYDITHLQAHSKSTLILALVAVIFGGVLGIFILLLRNIILTAMTRYQAYQKS